MAVMQVTDGPAVGRRAILRLAVGAWLMSVAGCTSAANYPAGPLRIASGGRGGVYFLYAQGIAAVVRASLPKLKPEVIATAASVENVELVASGQAELGLTTADAAVSAYQGSTPFAGPLPVLALGRIYDSYLQLVVRLDRGITSLEDLRGRRISIGPVGSGTALISGRILPLAGVPLSDLTAEELDPADAAAAVQSGQLDGMFFSGGIPTDAIAQLTATTSVAFIPLGEYVAPMRARYGEVYVERTIPASAYRLGKPTVTLGVANYLVVHREMDSSLAYQLLRALFERRDLLAAAHPEGSHLDRGEAISTYPLPLHPGASRYYQDMKR